jgi:hypothetical protein
MRARAIGLGLLGLGAFLLVGALAFPLFLAHSLVELPRTQGDVHAVAVSSDAEYFDFQHQQAHTGEPVTARQRVVTLSDAAGASDTTAVWSSGTTIADAAGHLITPVSEYVVCLDRHTAQAVVDCTSSSVGGDHGKKIHGLTLNFPFDVKKQSYAVFDANAQVSSPARYVGEDTIQGLKVYKFAQSVPETMVTTALATVRYSNERTIWVDPTSGVIVNIEEHPKTVLPGAAGSADVTVLAGTFSGDKTTVADGVARAKKADGQISLVRTVAPLSLLALGVVAVVAGALLARRGAGGNHPGQDADVAGPGDTALVPQVQ